jgi:hypothetical protein
MFFFSSREEAKPMSDFISSKDIRIHAASNWVMRNEIDLIEKRFIYFFKDKKVNYAVDKVKDRDIYLEHVQNEGQERDDDDVSLLNRRKKKELFI